MTHKQRKPGGKAVKRGARRLRRGERKLKRASDAKAPWLLVTEQWVQRSLFTQAEFDAWWERSKVTLEDMKAMTLTPEDIKDLTP
jgi:hypothetical protein